MEEIDLKELIGVFWKKKFLIIIVVAIFAVLGLIYSNMSKSPIYESSTTLILVPEKSKDAENFADYYHIVNDNETIEVEKTYHETSRLSTELSINTRILTSSTVIATSQTVADKVIENLKLDMSADTLLSSVTVTPTAETQSLKIAVTNTDAETACSLANEISKVFVEEAEKIFNTESFHILDKAVISSTPINSTSPLKNIIIFAFVGAVLIAGYILVIYMFDTSVKSIQDIENVVSLSNFATIFDIKDSANKIVEDSEMFRTLRTNIESQIENSDNKVVLITSPDTASGKTFVVGNLAYAFSKLNKKVLVVDADLNDGVQHTLFNLDKKSGLSDFLSAKNGDIRNYIKETHTENLYLLSSGECKENASDLLASQKMKETLEILKQSFDIIIIDSSNCLNSSASLVLTKIADLTLLVVAQNKTKIEDLEKAKSAIEKTNSKITGVILNKTIQNTKKCICTCFKKDK